MPKRTKVANKTYIVIPILRTTSGGGAEKDNCSAETEKIGAENAKIKGAEKSAETGGNQCRITPLWRFCFSRVFKAKIRCDDL